MSFNTPPISDPNNKIHLVKERIRLRAAIDADDLALANGEAVSVKDKASQAHSTRSERRPKLLKELAVVEDALNTFK